MASACAVEAFGRGPVPARLRDEAEVVEAARDLDALRRRLLEDASARRWKASASSRSPCSRVTTPSRLSTYAWSIAVRRQALGERQRAAVQRLGPPEVAPLRGDAAAHRQVAARSRLSGTERSRISCGAGVDASAASSWPRA